MPRAHSVSPCASMSSTRSAAPSRRRCSTRRSARCAGCSNLAPGEVRHAGVCLFDPGWHQGVVGLVASRVKERVRRPVIAFASADELTLRGSARSVDGIHIRDVLDAIATRHPELISRFGGHAMAAGLTLERARLDEFARAFDAEVARCAPGTRGGCGRDRRRAGPRRDRARYRAGAACRRSLGRRLSRAELRRALQHQERAR